MGIRRGVRAVGRRGRRGRDSQQDPLVGTARADADAPVLLFLDGGPGGTATGSMRVAGKPLEKDFVVATWDQRGTGASAHALEPTSTLTLDQMVADTIEVTEYLHDRFDEQAIFVVGSSWATLGVLAVQQQPGLYHAYIGTGQLVDQFETDKLMYAELLAYAERVGDEAVANRLREIGEPPYDDTLAYIQALAANPEWVDYPPAGRTTTSAPSTSGTLSSTSKGCARLTVVRVVSHPTVRRRAAATLDVIHERSRNR